MKSNKNFRASATHGLEPEDLVRRAAKLEPNKKSGKQHRAIYKELDDAEDEDELLNYKKKESTFDYFDDGSDEEYDDEEYDEEYDDDDEYEDDEDDLLEEEEL